MLFVLFLLCLLVQEEKKLLVEKLCHANDGGPRHVTSTYQNNSNDQVIMMNCAGIVEVPTNHTLKIQLPRPFHTGSTRCLYIWSLIEDVSPDTPAPSPVPLAGLASDDSAMFFRLSTNFLASASISGECSGSPPTFSGTILAETRPSCCGEVIWEIFPASTISVGEFSLATHTSSGSFNELNPSCDKTATIPVSAVFLDE